MLQVPRQLLRMLPNLEWLDPVLNINCPNVAARPADQVKDQELQMPESIFYIVSKNPQVKHIA